MAGDIKINYKFNNTLGIHKNKELRISEPSIAKWYKGSAADNQLHFERYQKRWFLLKGRRILARTAIKKEGDRPTTFAEFKSWCKIFLEVPKKKIRERAKSFEEEMQFFSAYWFRRDQ